MAQFSSLSIEKCAARALLLLRKQAEKVEKERKCVPEMILVKGGIEANGNLLICIASLVAAMTEKSSVTSDILSCQKLLLHQSVPTMVAMIIQS